MVGHNSGWPPVRDMSGISKKRDMSGICQGYLKKGICQGYVRDIFWLVNNIQNIKNNAKK